MQQQFKNSLKLQLLLKTILISTAVSFILTVVSTVVDYNTNLKRVDDQISSIEESIIVPLSKAIWRVDEEIVQLHMENIFKHEDIISYALASEEFSTTRVKFESFKFPLMGKINKTFDLHYYIDNTQFPLGKLQVVFTKQKVFLLALKRALNTFFFQAIKTFIVGFILLYIYEKIVVKDLIRISRGLKSIDIKNVKESDYIPLKRTEDDEISIIQHQINEMTAELSRVTKQNQKLIDNANFRAEQEKAKSINAARLASLGEMAAGIAHEINNPLAIIDGHVYSAKKIIEKIEDQKGENALRHMETVLKSVERISNIITGMSKVSRNTENDKKRPVAIYMLLDDVLGYLKETLKKEDIAITFVNTTSVQVYIKETELFQVLINLINNSKHAIKDLDEKWIKIKFIEEDEHLIISVKDSGEGINQEIADSIFDPFFTTKDIGHGTGLGLSISKTSMINMGGDLFLNSQSENTEFCIRVAKYHSPTQTETSLI